MNSIQNWKTSLSTHRKEITIVLPILIALVLFSILIRYQGWRSRTLGNWDMLIYYLGAESMVHDGTVMEKGDLSSYHSYQPPGTEYLALPGVLLLNDPRLFSLPGDLLVNLATIVFLYLIFRQGFGRGLALAICVVFGFSRLVFMGIWPIGHPVYALGMVWFLMQWIRKRSAWWLFGALVIAAFGLYVDLAILPFLFVLPVLWILFRPPLRVVPILLGLLIGLLIWYPYLHYEAGQNYADIKSIFFLRPIPGQENLAAQTPTYCYASLPGEMDSINDTYIPFTGAPGSMDRVVFYEQGWEKYHRICVFLSNLDRNFDGGFFLTPNSAVAAGLWFLFLVGLFASIGMALVHGEGKIHLLGRLRKMDPKTILGIGLIGSLGLFLFFTPGFLAKFSADGKLQKPTQLVAIQLQYYAPLIFSAALFGIFLGLRAPKRDLKDIAPLLIVWIPWLLLATVAERTRSERFYWIWSFQVAVLVFAVFQILNALSNVKWWKGAAVLILAVAVFPLSFYLPSIRGWMEHGYGGADSAQMQAIGFIHGELAREGKQDASIGYDLLSTYYGRSQPEDSRIRNGSWFDLIFEARWGIRNLNQSPSGLESGDAWRILESETPSLNVASPWQGYSAAAVFGPYMVFKRDQQQADLLPSTR